MTTARVEPDEGDIEIILGALDHYRGLLLDNCDTAVSDAEREHFKHQAGVVAELTDRLSHDSARLDVRGQQ